MFFPHSFPCHTISWQILRGSPHPSAPPRYGPALIPILSHNMDEFEKQAQTLESVHSSD